MCMIDDKHAHMCWAECTLFGHYSSNKTRGDPPHLVEEKHIRNRTHLRESSQTFSPLFLRRWGRLTSPFIGDFANKKKVSPPHLLKKSRQQTVQPTRL